jgi:hypothetical protein
MLASGREFEADGDEDTVLPAHRARIRDGERGVVGHDDEVETDVSSGVYDVGKRDVSVGLGRVDM